MVANLQADIYSVWGERPDRNKQGLGRAQRNKESIVLTFPDCLGGPLRPGLTSLAARCTRTQFPWMRTGVPGLGLRHPRNPGETKMRRHKLSSELSSSSQGPGLSPSKHHLPRTRIFEISQEGRKLCWKNKASSRETVRLREAFKPS